MHQKYIYRNPRALVSFAVFVFFLAAVAAAETRVVYNGIDLWKTAGDGASYLDFADEPIPAGFFCPGSKPFRGRIVWQGVPLATQPAGVLGEADTIIYRLDDAVFDEDGRALTRLRAAALSFVSTEPIRTSCGRYEVRASLHGEQPVTEMQIVRERENGGLFTSTLALNVRLTFTPVSKVKARQSVFLERTVEFLPTHPILWSEQTEEESRVLQLKGFALVDTDGDAGPDTFLPGTSNFFPGADATVLRELGIATKIYSCWCGIDDYLHICNCHYQSGSCHCGAPP